MSGVKGDFDELAALSRNLRRLAEVPSRMATKAAEGISDAIQQQFDAGVDPYGEPWEPLAPSTLARKQGPGILDETSAMRDGIEVAPTGGAGVGITFNDKPDVAMYHQYGTARMPARKILPEEGLPDTWERALADAAEDEIERTMKRG